MPTWSCTGTRGGGDERTVKMAKKIAREVVSYEIGTLDFPELKGVLGPNGSIEVSEKEYDELRSCAERGILGVVLSDSYQYGRNGGGYIACICADTTGGRRRRAPDSVERILSRCRELDRRVNLSASSFDLEARLMVELAKRGGLKRIRNYRFEMKPTMPGAGGGELRTISAESRKEAEHLYWAWSSFDRKKCRSDGAYLGRSGVEYVLTVTEEGRRRR